MWVGAVMEDIGHCKMLHDMDAGPLAMSMMPFLAVSDDGKRFCNEMTSMEVMNNLLRDIIPPKDTAGWYSQIFDSEYINQKDIWGQGVSTPEALEVFMPDVDVERVAVLPDYIRTFKADTLDELAEKLEIDAEGLKESVARYNELCAGGIDKDFGKESKYMVPVVTPPFYGIHRWLRTSAVCSGLVVDANCQCLDKDGNLIKGLYAVGETGGQFYAGVDYPLSIGGINLGHCFTQGRVAAQYVADL
jgi:succinate dehydrogenase/fumarate reductase flavoprotein subunit